MDGVVRAEKALKFGLSKKAIKQNQLDSNIQK